MGVQNGLLERFIDRVTGSSTQAVVICILQELDTSLDRFTACLFNMQTSRKGTSEHELQQDLKIINPVFREIQLLALSLNEPAVETAVEVGGVVAEKQLWER